ncbi:DUF1284 domain-containing protein [Salinisphaera sp. USBA-960]|uniref:DUF1284 domain-containing protein n=1 Tax=Salinisphaera orenii TaxID=856731 RepID=UPI000DBE7794|nr:DUF1284 domain-containing protein [Salifodinibacter halophilus]NNC25882.1 DUF1284 domain-containing protein [Salifodinibacter halophilus]
MSVCLRPHHLLCTLTYIGKGYNADFIANYDRVIERIKGCEPVRIVEGPDDICAPLLEGNAHPHCLEQRVVENDRLAARDVEPLLGQTIRPGASLDFDPKLVAQLRQAFVAGDVRAACHGCEWANLCNTISANGFPDTAL